MRLTNKTKWNTGDLRKLILETIERSGYETNKRIVVETSKSGGYNGRASINGNWVKMRVPKFFTQTTYIQGSNGEEKVEQPIQFNTVEFSKILTHELNHNAGLQHEDMIDYDTIDCEGAKDFVVNPQQEKPKVKIDWIKARYGKVLDKIKERESKLKRLQNQLRKLYRKKKYYEKSK